MGSGESSAATALPETGLLNYLIAMQERAYTGDTRSLCAGRVILLPQALTA